MNALPLLAQTAAQVDRLDPALDAIVPVDAALEKVATGFQFTEGPVWSPAGFLLFTDINAAVINRRLPSGKAVLFLGPSEFTQKDAEVAGVPGKRSDLRQGRPTGHLRPRSSSHFVSRKER